MKHSCVLAVVAAAGISFIPTAHAAQIELSFSLTEFGNPSHVVTGSASLSGTPIGLGNDAYHATGGSITVNGVNDSGTYDLVPAGPALTVSPTTAFAVDNMIYTVTEPHLDYAGLLGFRTTTGVELSVWGVSPGVYSVYAWTPGSGYSTTFTGYGFFGVTVSGVPDTGSTLALLGCGLIALGAFRSRRS